MSHTEHALHTFMAQITSEMASEYQRIYARTIEDPGTAGDEGEENWATLLREWLPPNYHVETKGRLIAADGSMSPQIDVLVLKPFYPKKLREKKVWLANGVAAAFECKNTLKSDHVTDSIERCRAFKSLFLRRTGTPQSELRSSLIYGILAHSHVWKSPGSNPVDNVTSALDKTLPLTDHPSNMIDLVCVADAATWTATATCYYEAAWHSSPADLEKTFGGKYGASTAMMCASLTDPGQQVGFQPIGAAIAYLTQRLAWNDASIRDLADYYTRAQLWGTGSGNARLWSPAIYSNEVARQLPAKLTNGLAWDEWSVGLF